MSIPSENADIPSDSLSVASDTSSSSSEHRTLLRKGTPRPNAFKEALEEAKHNIEVKASTEEGELTEEKYGHEDIPTEETEEIDDALDQITGGLKRLEIRGDGE